MLSIAVYQSFFNGTDIGIIQMPNLSQKANPLLGYHNVTYCEYNDPTKYVKFDNLWSNNQANDGHGYLSYNYIIDDYCTHKCIVIDKQITDITYKFDLIFNI